MPEEEDQWHEVGARADEEGHTKADVHRRDGHFGMWPQREKVSVHGAQVLTLEKSAVIGWSTERPDWLEGTVKGFLIYNETSLKPKTTVLDKVIVILHGNDFK